MIGSSHDALSKFDSDLKKKSSQKSKKNRGKRKQAPVRNVLTNSSISFINFLFISLSIIIIIRSFHLFLQ